MQPPVGGWPGTQARAPPPPAGASAAPRTETRVKSGAPDSVGAPGPTPGAPARAPPAQSWTGPREWVLALAPKSPTPCEYARLKGLLGRLGSGGVGWGGTRRGDQESAEMVPRLPPKFGTCRAASMRASPPCPFTKAWWRLWEVGGKRATPGRHRITLTCPNK